MQEFRQTTDTYIHAHTDIDELKSCPATLQSVRTHRPCALYFSIFARRRGEDGSRTKTAYIALHVRDPSKGSIRRCEGSIKSPAACGIMKLAHAVKI